MVNTMWGRSVYVVLLVAAVVEVSADISNSNPPTGSCLCLSGSSVNIRDTACGNVIGSGSTGLCLKYLGQKVGCTLSGTFYQFFQVNYGSSGGWIAGTYLNQGSDSQCGSVSEPDSEFRSVFVATAWNVDWPTSSSDSVSSQQQQLITYLNTMTSTNMNAMVFQVRPAGDAMYNSAIEPWSAFLTGTQGVAPSPLWDPLSYLVTQAHNRGIEVHAWLNPYRANLSPNWNGLAPNHMANVYRQYAYPYSNYLWMDPGASVVADHLVNVITDILTRYDVDGIHFDDYFYPYPDGTQFPDSATYNAYVGAGGSLSRDDWRRDNVNRMVQRVNGVVHSTKPGCKFSISPFGIYRPGVAGGMPSPITGLDPYSEQYADTKKWLQSGWVDILAPQLYWAIDPPAQSYPVLLDWWLDANTASRHIYASNGVYKIDDSNNWPVSEIQNQISLSRDSTRRSKLSLGNIMYSAKFFRDNTKSITTIFQSQVYTKPATIPAMAWMNIQVPHQPTDVAIDTESTVLSWRPADVDRDDSGVIVRWWVVTRRNSPQHVDTTIVAVLPRHTTSLRVNDPGMYSVQAVNAAWQLSPMATVSVV